ncbi:hypothetical protein [Chlorobaculum tepidum]|uniref:hypothetical protein n=1 Tax=Chlorobaculum tepidum TaxID=1097 RepID=UPI001D03F71B|nr:hypothetical protein [Chlorobaculum tepidum]
MISTASATVTTSAFPEPAIASASSSRNTVCVSGDAGCNTRQTQSPAATATRLSRTISAFLIPSTILPVR